MLIVHFGIITALQEASDASATATGLGAARSDQWHKHEVDVGWQDEMRHLYAQALTDRLIDRWGPVYIPARRHRGPGFTRSKARGHCGRPADLLLRSASDQGFPDRSSPQRATLRKSHSSDRFMPLKSVSRR